MASPSTLRRWRTLVTVLFAAYAVLNTYFVLTPVLGPAPSAVMMLVPVLMGGFSLTHAVYTLGIWHAAGFFALSIAVSFTFEAIGVATGSVFGPYHYSDTLGPKLLDVPLLIPLAWFMVIYPSYALANYITTGRAVSRPRTKLPRLVGVVLLSAVLMTAWDLLLDPQATQEGYWVWDTQGAYFGIPVQNFVGWLITTSTVYLAYRLAEARWPPKPCGPAPPLFEALPLFLYGLLASGYVVGYLLKGVPVLAMIAFFVMGAPCLIALTRTAEPTTPPQGHTAETQQDP